MERLLLIEDDETTRELLLVLMEAEGWAVHETANGNDAVTAARGIQPDVILSDIQIPGLCGPALAEALRSACRVPPLLIAMTATPRSPGAPEGFDALLVKPFDPADLRRVCDAIAPAAPEENFSAQTGIAAGTLERLRSSMPQHRVRALYDFALADAETRVQKMAAAAEAGDEDALRRDAHALKGSAGMIGAMRLHALAAEIEERRLTNTPAPWKCGERIYEEIRRVRLMLEEILLRDN